MSEVVAAKENAILGPKLNLKNGRIDLSRGSGGRAMAQLIDQLFIPAFANPWLKQKNDQACFSIPGRPHGDDNGCFCGFANFFPGGDIGTLSVNGTVNDIAMAGAKPLYLSVSFILEEGFPLYDLTEIVYSMAEAAKKANVVIITGDTKVVEHGKGDGIYITTTGVGMLPENIFMTGKGAKPGDQVILSGFIGDHGVAIMSKRNHLDFLTQVQSDTAPLYDLVRHMLCAVPSVHCLRDPTRGGVATTLNEWAMQSQVGFIIDEKIPIRQEVASACELLGLDALYVANEGKLLAICPVEDSFKLLEAMHAHPQGKDATIIGHVVDDPRCFVQLKTRFGGMRILDWLNTEQLPRIC